MNTVKAPTLKAPAAKERTTGDDGGDGQRPRYTYLFQLNRMTFNNRFFRRYALQFLFHLPQLRLKFRLIRGIDGLNGLLFFFRAVSGGL